MRRARRSRVLRGHPGCWMTESFPRLRARCRPKAWLWPDPPRDAPHDCVWPVRYESDRPTGRGSCATGRCAACPVPSRTSQESSRDEQTCLGAPPRRCDDRRSPGWPGHTQHRHDVDTARAAPLRRIGRLPPPGRHRTGQPVRGPSAHIPRLHGHLDHSRCKFPSQSHEHAAA